MAHDPTQAPLFETSSEDDFISILEQALDDLSDDELTEMIAALVLHGAIAEA